jgi:hypothetical protein
MAGQQNEGAVIAAFLLSRNHPPAYEEALCETGLTTSSKR